MSDVVNLNKAHKAKARVQKRAQADANAAKFGRTKAQKVADQTVTDQQVRHIDGHKLKT